MEFHRGPGLYRDLGLIDEPGSALDGAVAYATEWLAAGKAYTVLAFLFGYGVALMVRRADAAGTPAGPRLVRRFAALFVLGVAHTVLLFFGDVLTQYALAGTALLLLVRAADRTVLAWAAALIVVPALLLALANTAAPPYGDADVRVALADTEAAVRAYTDGPGTAVAQRVRDASYALPGVLFYLPQNVGLLAIGLWAGRRRLLERPPRATRRAAAAGLAAGLPLNLVVAEVYEGGLPSGAAGAGATLAILLAPLVLAAGYLAGLLVLLERPGPRRALTAALAPLGRVSLTAYLGQSLVAALLFTADGLGLYGDVGPAAGLALALALFAAQCLAARAYLRRRATGPAERLVRAVTYGGRG